MTWRQQTVVRILLIIARLIAGDECGPAFDEELKRLATHISVARRSEVEA